MSEEHPERIYLQRAPPIISPQLYRELLEDHNIPEFIKRDLWSLTSPLQTQGFITKEDYGRLRALARVIELLYIMSLPPRSAANVILHVKQLDYYHALLLSRSINGYERATIFQQTPIQQREEKKPGFLEKLFGLG